MAKFNPPASFPFDKPTEWLDWKQRFERYRLATKLHKDEGEVQVSCLIYAMGSEAENIYKSFTFADDEDRNDFAVVMGKFDDYFFPRRNTIHERACFHQRVQRPGEKAECFIRALYDLSEHCEFGATREENIRDRIVVGILDRELSRRLQLMENLTLALTIQTVRQSEEVAAQVSLQGDTVGAVQEVQFKRKKTHTGKHNTNNKASLKTENGEEKIRNVDGVAKHNITKMKNVLQREPHVITVIKLDTGLEHAAAVDQ